MLDCTWQMMEAREEVEEASSEEELEKLKVSPRTPRLKDLPSLLLSLRIGVAGADTAGHSRVRRDVRRLFCI